MHRFCHSDDRQVQLELPQQQQRTCLRAQRSLTTCSDDALELFRPVAHVHRVPKRKPPNFGVVENVMQFCWKYSSSIQQWKNFENRLRFEKVIAKSLVASFFETRCRTSQFSVSCQFFKISFWGVTFSEHRLDMIRVAQLRSTDGGLLSSS